MIGTGEVRLSKTVAPSLVNHIGIPNVSRGRSIRKPEVLDPLSTDKHSQKCKEG